MFDFTRMAAMLSRVSESREPELVLLNGHLLIERMLIDVLAVRLTCLPEEVPRLGFRQLAELAFRDSAACRPVVRLNELRNLLAHQFDAMDTQRFREIVASFDFDWPEGQLDRAAVVHLIVSEVQGLLLRRMIEEISLPPVFAGDWSQEEDDSLRGLAESVEEHVRRAKQLIALGEFDSVVNILRPGWSAGRQG